ncbi:MAG: DUF6069 family protein [Thermomicrobiales bacterium]
MLRVVLAYTMPIHAVPAMQTGMMLATVAIMQVVTNAWYLCTGLWPRLHGYGPAGDACIIGPYRTLTHHREVSMQRTPTLPSWAIRTGSIVLAIVVNVVIILVSRGLAGNWPHATVQDDEQVIRVGEVVAGIVAWLVAMLIERLAPRPARIWTIVGVVVWAVSLLSLTGAANASSVVTLGLLHTVTAAILIAGMLRTLPERRA